MGRKYGQVGSDVHPVAIEIGMSRYHIYSLQYQFKQFYYLNNSFKSGMFSKVRYLLMADQRPFEHNFFKVISQDFPFLKTLSIFNNQPQQDKQQSSISIIFPHLICLYLVRTHVNYAEQFLFNRNTHLSSLLNLKFEPFVRPKNFDEYFLYCKYEFCLKLYQYDLNMVQESPLHNME
jgi:hypothetical protein